MQILYAHRAEFILMVFTILNNWFWFCSLWEEIRSFIWSTEALLGGSPIQILSVSQTLAGIAHRLQAFLCSHKRWVPAEVLRKLDSAASSCASRCGRPWFQSTIMRRGETSTQVHEGRLSNTISILLLTRIWQDETPKDHIKSPVHLLALYSSFSGRWKHGIYNQTQCGVCDKSIL